MTEHKFTDEEVIDSLHYHQSGALARCCQCAYLNCYENCSERLAKDALDLINRQKAEIENLVDAVDNSTKEFLKLHDEYQEQKAEVAYWMDAAANAKREAVNKFAERLKEKLIKGGIYPVLVKSSINDIVKEMMGETNGKK